MNIIAVDDERHALNRIKNAIDHISADARVSVFTSTTDALEYARKSRIDVAFLDIEMADMDGLALAKHLKDIYGATNIIFVTGHRQYAGSAFEVRASGYVIKPITPEQVAKELDDLRHPVPAADRGIRIQCFGNFEIFVDGNPVHFGRAKSKEVFAYLVDRRGASVNKREIAAILWEDGLYDRSRQKQLQVMLKEMMRSLEEAGIAECVTKSRGLYAIDVFKVECDYYDYYTGNAGAVNSYHGEYMTNYSWAEFTAGLLSERKV